MTTSVFNNAAMPYAAFNIRDPYYTECARLIMGTAKRQRMAAFDRMRAIDLGAGIGISTRELLRTVRSVLAVEPDPSMRSMCYANTLGDPRVEIRDARGENLSSVVFHDENFEDVRERKGMIDLVVASQVFHIFHPPNEESHIPVVLREIRRTLASRGIFAFDLGPSNYEFRNTPIVDHRNPRASRGGVITELAHPLYQLAHTYVYKEVKAAYPNFDREDLWPPTLAKMSFDFLNESFRKAGFSDLMCEEHLMPISGMRVIEFIRNGWTVFFRWGVLSELESEEKLTMIEDALHRLYRDKNFDAYCRQSAYHPSAVFTARVE